MAGIFAALPMPWDKYTAQMIIRESPKFSRVLNGSWSKMPEEIRQWRCTVSREQVELYDMEHPELPESA